MTRSIGDLVASSVGVSWEPEVTKYKISQNDRFMIMATDGVWEFLENVDVSYFQCRNRNRSSVSSARSMRSMI